LLFSDAYSVAHEVWTTLRGDGEKAPFYVSTIDPRLAEEVDFSEEDHAHIETVPVLRNPNTKMNVLPAERAMLSYLFYMIHIAKFFNRGMLHCEMFFII
jgi:hypothetical protein